jgi:hypothetical protein
MNPHVILPNALDRVLQAITRLEPATTRNANMQQVI